MSRDSHTNWSRVKVAPLRSPPTRERQINERQVDKSLGHGSGIAGGMNKQKAEAGSGRADSRLRHRLNKSTECLFINAAVPYLTWANAPEIRFLFLLYGICPTKYFLFILLLAVVFYNSFLKVSN